MGIVFEGAAEPLGPAGDDSVRPFVVEALDVRGRVIQMGPALDAILARHDYPPPVSRLLAEAIVLAVLLGSSLKIDGRFTLQTETDGPVDMLVVDYRTTGAIRAYARFDKDKVAEAEADGAATPGALLLGKGTLAMTIDQGAHDSRYQGVVPLEGESLEEVAHTYFRQSEQIPTRVRLAVAEMHAREGGAIRHSWRAGGLLVQFLPEAPGAHAPARSSRRRRPGGRRRRSKRRGRCLGRGAGACRHDPGRRTDRSGAAGRESSSSACSTSAASASSAQPASATSARARARRSPASCPISPPRKSPRAPRTARSR